MKLKILTEKKNKKKSYHSKNKNCWSVNCNSGFFDPVYDMNMFNKMMGSDIQSPDGSSSLTTGDGTSNSGAGGDAGSGSGGDAGAGDGGACSGGAV